MIVFCLIAAGCGKKSSSPDAASAPGVGTGGVPAGTGQTGSSPDGTGADAVKTNPASDGSAKVPVDGGLRLDASGPVVDTCTKPADCAGADVCPADAVNGCTCVAMSTGKTCLPRCSTNRDCPKSSEVVLGCTAAGLCIPASKITLDGGPRPNLGDAKRATDAVSGDANHATDADALAPDAQ
jgi:hypothetical protein